MKKYKFRLAEKKDSDGLVNLFRLTPQEGRVVINFERNPDYFIGNGVVASDTFVLIAIETSSGNVVGCSSFGCREVFVNGKPKKIRYAGDLRVHPDHRQGIVLVGIYRESRKHLTENEWMQTAVLEENLASINTITKKRSSLPSYYRCGRLKSHLVYVPRKVSRVTKKTFNIRNATSADVENMQIYFDGLAPEYQFYPVYKFENIQKNDPYYFGLKIEDYSLCINPNGELIGVLGIWNQKQFKQTRIMDYKGGMQYVRYLYNLYSMLVGALRLPSVGGELDYMSLHSLLIKDNDPEVFDALLCHCFERLKLMGCGALLVGVMDDDALKHVIGRFRCREHYTLHYLATYGDFDPREILDSRSLYLETVRL